MSRSSINDKDMEPWRWRFEKFVTASPRLVIENFLDLDHLFYVHEGSFDYHRVIETGRLAGLVDMRTRVLGIPVVHREWVQLLPPDRMLFRSSLLGGMAELHVDSRVLEQEGGTLLRTDYSFTPPWFLRPFRGLLLPVMQRIKERIWEQDVSVLVRRQKLRERGFRDGAPIRMYFPLETVRLLGDPA